MSEAEESVVVPFPGGHVTPQAPSGETVVFKKGDTVTVKASPYHTVKGIIADTGMISVMFNERTYTVRCFDGVTRVVYAHNIFALPEGAAE